MQQHSSSEQLVSRVRAEQWAELVQDIQVAATSAEKGPYEDEWDFDAELCGVPVFPFDGSFDLAEAIKESGSIRQGNQTLSALGRELLKVNTSKGIFYSYGASFGYFALEHARGCAHDHTQQNKETFADSLVIDDQALIIFLSALATAGGDRQHVFHVALEYIDGTEKGQAKVFGETMRLLDPLGQLYFMERIVEFYKDHQELQGTVIGLLHYFDQSLKKKPVPNCVEWYLTSPLAMEDYALEEMLAVRTAAHLNNYNKEEKKEEKKNPLPAPFGNYLTLYLSQLQAHRPEELDYFLQRCLLYRDRGAQEQDVDLTLFFPKAASLYLEDKAA